MIQAVNSWKARRLSQQTSEQERHWFLQALWLKGTTEISEIYHIERGYEKFTEKFNSLGANIFRIED